MTSNVGANFIFQKQQLGFLKEKDLEYSKIKLEVNNQIKKEFKPEFLNRIDEIIIFHKLTKEELGLIFNLLIKKIQEKLSEKEIKLEIEEDVKKFILNKKCLDEYGARPLKRELQNSIENLITDAIIEGKVKEGMNIKIVLDNENKLKII